PPQGISAFSLSSLKWKVLGLLPHREADLEWVYNSRAKAHHAHQRVFLQARRPSRVQPSWPRPAATAMCGTRSVEPEGYKLHVSVFGFFDTEFQSSQRSQRRERR